MRTHLLAAVVPLAVAGCATAAPLPPVAALAPATQATVPLAPLARVEVVSNLPATTDPADWVAANDARGPGAGE